LIDAVVLWVDGDDPIHKKKRQRYSGEALQPETKPEGSLPTRFADSGEIFYCLKLIRKNAKWINRIFLVTDQQYPSWLDQKEKKKLDVTVVDHRDLFKGLEQFLPTFNSSSIETNLHRIPGISDHYLYFNDDMFLLKSTNSEDYFKEHRPVMRGVWLDLPSRWRLINFIRNPKRKRVLSMTERPIGLIGARAEHKMVTPRFGYRFFAMAHTPQPFSKHFVNKMFAKYDKSLSNCQYRFRDRRQYNMTAMAAQIGLKTGEILAGPSDWAYIDPDTFSDAEALEKIERLETRDTNLSLCIQSLDMFSQSTRLEMLGFLERTLRSSA